MLILLPLGLITLHKDRPIRETYGSLMFVISNPLISVVSSNLLQCNYNLQVLHQDIETYLLQEFNLFLFGS